MTAKEEKIKKFLDKTNKTYKKKYGADVIYFGSEVQDFKPLKTGFPTFDYGNSGIGGFPRGGVTLIHGAESTGKSSFVLESFAFSQNVVEDFSALYIDVEGSLTKTFLEFKKINPSKITVTRLNCEDALAVAEDSLKENIYDAMCMDSLAKFESTNVLDKDINESVSRGARAKMLSEFFRRSIFILRSSNTALICINQEIENQNKKTPYDPPTILPCGKAQKFAANLRIELKRSKAIKDGEKKIGYKVSFTSIKNKISNKEKTMTYLTYLYDRGFVRELSLLDYLITIDYVKKLPMNRFEFVDKNLYPDPFKPGQMIAVANRIKEANNLDLFSIEPNESSLFEKNESAGDIPTSDEINAVEDLENIQNSELEKLES